MRIRSLLVICCLFFGSLGQAAERGPVVKPAVPAPASTSFTIFATPEWRYERGSDLDLGWVSALGFGFEVRHKFLALVVETLSFKDKSGNGTLSIEREHRDYIVSGHFFFWETSGNAGDFGVYAAGGAGFFNETVRTTLTGMTTSDTGDREFLGVAGVGAEANMKISTSNTALSFAVEARILSSKNFDPNPEPGVLARVGVRF